MFIFQKFAEICYSVFAKRSSFKILLNLRKAYIFQEFAEGLLSICVCWIFQSVIFLKFALNFTLDRAFIFFSMVRHCLWKMCATPGACITETGLFSSAAVVPQSKSTELCSSATDVPQSKSTKKWISVAPYTFHQDLCSALDKRSTF